MKFKKIYLLGIIVGMALIAADIYYLLNTRWFWPLLIIAITITWSQFWMDTPKIPRILDATSGVSIAAVRSK